MKRYLVGGAVRDGLLGLTPHERDWVVVGSTPEQMRAAGFTQVGRDFPVFLHPQTKEEHALARTERKSGAGHQGFVVHASPEVTLEDDLIRRDLTVNAIAEDESGALIDPHGGARDIENRWLRHVSPAFSEDPLRVLRLARFAARFAPLGFRVADETLALCRQLVATGALRELSAERVWQETVRAINESPAPSVFFTTLDAVGGLADWFGWLSTTALPLSLAAVDQATADHADPVVRAAAWMAPAAAQLTPVKWDAVCQQLRVPNDISTLVATFVASADDLHHGEALAPDALLRRLEGMSAFRRSTLFDRVLAVDAVLAQGVRRRAHTAFWQAARAQAEAVQARDVMTDGLRGPAISDALAAARTQRLADWRQAFGRA
ncbi:CCA tRNA nucleotidyltransferase [Polycyclovorans algicola]|uniref:CCA tRNA nucleotidyltransferase n=1 Tax=Polycyclovorans algicola TaxID=616992 RepID=UPI0005BA380A|nr:CCA tRNA nucleotidyltransferase [Polycyclovorans algicola]